jgi:uncharacterized membrane protein YdfJ with MMPL/SSD domain
MPMRMLAIIFGPSMDYEVCLLSRVRKVAAARRNLAPAESPGPGSGWLNESGPSLRIGRLP